MTDDDPSMAALYSQLRIQLAKAKPGDRERWWRSRHRAIALLQDKAPRLFAELEAIYRKRRCSDRGGSHDHTTTDHR